MPLYYESAYTSEDELLHYGVLGMKWGVRRAQSKSYRNDKLAKKALKYDKKSAKYTKKSEKIHADVDLEKSNRKALKAATYMKKAAIKSKKALTTDNDIKRDRYLSKAENLKYKAAKKQIEANRLSKSAGYGAKAMKWSVKSDIAAKKAAKARAKMANNTRYINTMNRRVNSLTGEEKKVVQDWMNSRLNWTT